KARHAQPAHKPGVAIFAIRGIYQRSEKLPVCSGHVEDLETAGKGMAFREDAGLGAAAGVDTQAIFEVCLGQPRARRQYKRLACAVMLELKAENHGLLDPGRHCPADETD